MFSWPADEATARISQSALETRQALTQRPSLPFAHGDLSGGSVGHNKQKAALEVRLDFYKLMVVGTGGDGLQGNLNLTLTVN
jgi:hypothetical protein